MDSKEAGLAFLEEHIEHHGVKGQRWGVRHDPGHEGQRAKTKKIAKLDKKFDRNATSFSVASRVNNRAAATTNKNDIERINNKPEYKGKNFLKDSPLRRKYYKEHQDAFIKNLDKAAAEFGTNASGTKKYGILVTDEGWGVRSIDVKHADETFNVKVNYDDNGYITSLEIPDQTMKQSDISDVVEEILSHHGVKGQRWGVRRSRSQLGGAARARVSTSLKSRRDRNASLTRRAKSLSDADIKKAIDRMELEKKFVDLSRGTTSAGKKYTRDIIESSGKQAAGSAVGASVGAVAGHFIKKALSNR